MIQYLAQPHLDGGLTNRLADLSYIRYHVEETRVYPSLGQGDSGHRLRLPLSAACTQHGNAPQILVWDGWKIALTAALHIEMQIWICWNMRCIV